MRSVRESRKKWGSSIESTQNLSGDDWLKDNGDGGKIAAGREDFKD